jgi:UDPglucose 6-dehydrogenase
MRESPSIELITELTKKGAVITAYDPAAMVEAKSHLPASITYAENAASCLTGADCAVLVTEWNEFRALTPLSFTELMAGNVLVDLRNVYDPSAIRAANIHYSSIGRA